MKKLSLVLCLVIGSTALAGCGSKMDANEKNFGSAVNQLLDKKGTFCLVESFYGFGRTLHWPLDVKPQDIGAPLNDTQLAALTSAGLVSVSDAEIAVEEHIDIGLFKTKTVNRKIKVKRYSLTELGQKSLRSEDSNICYGKATLDKVVKWEGPRKDGDYQEAIVTYTYQIKDQAEWLKNPQIQAAFPGVRNTLAGAGKREQIVPVKLTSQGWEPK